MHSSNQQNVVQKPLTMAVLAFAFLLISSTNSVAANNENAKDATDPAYKKAVALFQKASYAEALPEFEKLTNSKDVGELAKYYRALCLQNTKQYKAAQDQYMFLYKNAQDKQVRYKSWQALRALPQATASKTKRVGKIASTSKATAPKEGPGADMWITPGQDYGRSGPAATSEVNVTIIPTACGRRGR